MTGRDATLEHQIFGLSGRALCLALFTKYVGLTAYGVWAAIVELPTFVLVASSTFAVVWASVVSTAALLAAAGVARTWATGRFRLEQYATAAFIAGFSGYSYALIFRAITTANYDAAPTAFVPLIICILPAIRWFSLIIRKRNLKFTRDGDAA